MGDLRVWSVGHSTHQIEAFVGLLRQHGVEVVADVRSSPFSRFNPQFNRHVLQRELGAAGVGYLFLGEELGGRPRGGEFYDPDGHVLYGRLAESPVFESGLARLIQKAERSPLAMMCSEEEPAGCHRFLLITRLLRDRGIEITHIRGSGEAQPTEEVGTLAGWSDPVYEEASLLDGSLRSSWRSARPVPHRSRT